MSKKKGKGTAHYDEQLRTVQIALSNLQRRIIKDGRKLLVIIEGRNVGRKERTISRSRVTAHNDQAHLHAYPQSPSRGYFDASHQV